MGFKDARFVGERNEEVGFFRRCRSDHGKKSANQWYGARNDTFESRQSPSYTRALGMSAVPEPWTFFPLGPNRHASLGMETTACRRSLVPGRGPVSDPPLLRVHAAAAAWGQTVPMGQTA